MALRVNACATGLTQDVSSSVPGRSVTTSGEGSEKTRVPHVAQKRTALSRPLGITRLKAAGSPAVTLNPARGDGMDMPNAEPDCR
jgi:hypothetical protein